MKLNLRKARKLEARIVTDPEDMETSINVLASSSNEDAANEIAAAKKRLEEQNKDTLKLLEVRFSIRRKIEQANEAVGINAKVNEREMLRKQVEYYQLLAVNSTCSEKEMIDMLAAQRARLAKGEGYGTSSVNVNISLLTKEEKEALEQQQVALERKIEEIEEELLQKNVGAEITISPDEVAVLKTHGLL